MTSTLVVLSCFVILASVTSYTPKTQPLFCGPNEIEECVTDCPPEKTCRNRFTEIFCTLEYRPCTRKCVCARGYYRNSIGECITGEQCDRCRRSNEFFSCGSACDNECISINYQNRTNCPIVNIKCNEKCYCDDGYARDLYGNCIPINKCYTPCRDPNEEYICSKSCPPDLCVSLVALYNCDTNEVSRYRCRCKSGYFREREGSPCIPSGLCPQVRNSPDYQMSPYCNF